MPQKKVTSVADVTAYLRYIFQHYRLLQNFYDQRYDVWKFSNYRGKQKALNEIVRCITWGSKKYNVKIPQAHQLDVDTGYIGNSPIPKRTSQKFTKYRFGDDPVLARKEEPPDGRTIIVVGDADIPATAQGQIAAPVKPWYRHLKVISRRLGVFPVGHALEGQRRVLVLKGISIN